MKYLATYCLMSMAGKSNINESELLKVLKEIGTETNQDTAKVVCQQLKDKDIHELSQMGQEKISSMVGSSGPVAQTNNGQDNAQKKEEEKPKTEEDEEDVDIGDLFG